MSAMAEEYACGAALATGGEGDGQGVLTVPADPSVVVRGAVGGNAGIIPLKPDIAGDESGRQDQEGKAEEGFACAWGSAPAHHDGQRAPPWPRQGRSARSDRAQWVDLGGGPRDGDVLPPRVAAR